MAFHFSSGFGSLSHISGGTYRAVLAHTIAVDLGSEVLVDVVLDASSQRGHWRERCVVQYREL